MFKSAVKYGIKWEGLMRSQTPEAEKRNMFLGFFKRSVAKQAGTSSEQDDSSLEATWAMLLPTA